jgi:hypothetical protein
VRRFSKNTIFGSAGPEFHPIPMRFERSASILHCIAITVPFDSLSWQR